MRPIVCDSVFPLALHSEPLTLAHHATLGAFLLACLVLKLAEAVVQWPYGGYHVNTLHVDHRPHLLEGACPDETVGLSWRSYEESVVEIGMFPSIGDVGVFFSVGVCWCVCVLQQLLSSIDSTAAEALLHGSGYKSSQREAAKLHCPHTQAHPHGDAHAHSHAHGHAHGHAHSPES